MVYGHLLVFLLAVRYAFSKWAGTVLVGPCHHGMARPQVGIEERPPIRRVAANKLNKQSWTADEGWSSSLGVGRGANNPSLLKLMFRNTHG